VQLGYPGHSVSLTMRVSSL